MNNKRVKCSFTIRARRIVGRIRGAVHFALISLLRYMTPTELVEYSCGTARQGFQKSFL